jgi:cytochrome c oxidase cbb3-type subunit III
MTRRRWIELAVLVGTFAIVAASETHLVAQTALQPTNPPSALQGGEIAPTHSLANDFNAQKQLESATGSSTAALLKSPVSKVIPGAVPPPSDIQNPVANDRAATTRGMQYFNSLNCVGCHAANGGGGMGPALSNRYFQYGDSPAQIFLTITQGRPNGMPAWGRSLPDSVIWDLVAYIKQISQAPQPEWGTTISAKSPAIEQVPAEYMQTPTPWSYTEPFSYGQKPQGGKPSQ